MPGVAVDVAARQLEVVLQVRREARRSPTASRAATQASWPIDAARASSAASSVGTRRALSHWRRTSATSRASSESGSAPLSSAAAPSSSRPVSSSTNISWLMRVSVASDSARASPPRGGIIVCWSQWASDSAWPRSDSCPRRSLSRSRRSLISRLLNVAWAPARLCDHCTMLRRSTSIKLFDAFGIRIGVDASWFLILFLMIFMLSGPFRDDAAQLRRRRVPDHRGERAAAVRLADRPRARARAGGAAAGNRGQADRSVPVRWTDADEPRRGIAGRGLQDRDRRPTRDVRR